MNNRLGYMIAGAVVVGVLVFGVAVIVQQGSGAADAPCVEVGVTHEVVIRDSKAEPNQTKAKRCDVLVITNKDSVSRDMAFGDHDNHVVYNNVEQKQLRRNSSLTVTLDQVGSYRFHDHLDDEVEGYFTVTK